MQKRSDTFNPKLKLSWKIAMNRTTLGRGRKSCHGRILLQVQLWTLLVLGEEKQKLWLQGELSTMRLTARGRQTFLTHAACRTYTRAIRCSRTPRGCLGAYAWAQGVANKDGEVRRGGINMKLLLLMNRVLQIRTEKWGEGDKHEVTAADEQGVANKDGEVRRGGINMKLLPLMNRVLQIRTEKWGGGGINMKLLPLMNRVLPMNAAYETGDQELPQLYRVLLGNTALESGRTRISQLYRVWRENLEVLLTAARSHMERSNMLSNLKSDKHWIVRYIYIDRLYFFMQFLIFLQGPVLAYRVARAKCRQSRKGTLPLPRTASAPVRNLHSAIVAMKQLQVKLDNYASWKWNFLEILPPLHKILRWG